MEKSKLCDALEKIVEYMYHDEFKDYQASARLEGDEYDEDKIPQHIFHSVHVLSEHLDEQTPIT